MRYIELLAPARDLQTGIEAIKHGADAVYIGAPKFGARAAAGNSVEDIRQLVDFARPYGVKVYVTLNTIIYDHELEEVRQLVEKLSDAGVDALIVQDLALQCIIHNSQLNSQLRLHASTQMDNRTAEKVAWLRDLGFEQVVLARELTLEEISAIHQQVPDVRLEVFVHGAICVSYNGQCYASQYCFGRSANRGECAQFCRMPFDLIEEQGASGKEKVLLHQKHLLSLRDMNRSNDLEALLDAGASSLKIEGRLKDIAYVKNVVAYYRQRLDEIFHRRPEYRRSSLGHENISFTPNPAKSFNRLFTDYFLHGRTPDMANIYTPKSMGEPLGDSVSAIRDSQLHNGDGLCYINKEGELEGFRVNRVEGDKIYLADGSTFSFQTERKSGIYRNLDHDFEQQLSKPTATRKVGVRWLLKETDNGFLLRMTREDGKQVERTFVYPHEQARSAQREQIERQLARLGDTPYEATGTDLELSNEWFIPSSVLAEWRRSLLPSFLSTSPLLSPQTSDLRPQPSAFIPQPSSLSYLANVANHAARRFYLEHGATQVDWAMEVEKPQPTDERGVLIMTCRYCIRHELGMCPKRKDAPGDAKRLLRCEEEQEGLKMKNEGKFFLRLSDGRRFRLHFDCKQCQMMVYGK